MSNVCGRRNSKQDLEAMHRRLKLEATHRRLELEKDTHSTTAKLKKIENKAVQVNAYQLGEV